MKLDLDEWRVELFYLRLFIVLMIGCLFWQYLYALLAGYLPCAIGYLVYHAILTAHWKINNK